MSLSLGYCLAYLEAHRQLTALYRSAVLIFGLLSLVGCVRDNPRIIKSSGGYLTPSSAVRFWRTDTLGSFTVIRSYVNRINSSKVVQTSYHWKNKRLIEIQVQLDSPEPETTTLRFDDAEQLTFMQRQRVNGREALSATDISGFQQQARSLYLASDNARLAGNTLRQGIWLNANHVMSCDNQAATVAMTAEQVAQLKKLAAATSSVYLSWLENNRGSQLLYSSPTNLCLSQDE